MVKKKDQAQKYLCAHLTTQGGLAQSAAHKDMARERERESERGGSKSRFVCAPRLDIVSCQNSIKM